MKAPAFWTAAVAVLAAPATAMAQQGEPYYGHHMWDGDWHGWFFGPVSMLLLFVAVVVVALLVGRRLGGTPPPSAGPAGRTPLDILKERFARGEIDKEEYEERRRVLGE